MAKKGNPMDVVVWLICALHSKVGSLISAVKKPGPNGGVIALCPGCIEAGGRIREKHGVELIQQKVDVKPAEAKP